jgi:uncharacterized protein YjbI with pentapeptide repeats
MSLTNVSSGYLKACPSGLPNGWVCASVGTRSGFTANDGSNNDYWLLGPGVDLSAQDFTTLSNPTLSSSTPGIQLDLTNANLAGSDFSTTSFNYTKLSGANLSNANLSGASLYRTYVNGISNKRNVILPSGFSIMSRPSNLSNGPTDTIVGPGISLWQFDLSNWDLSGKNLSGAELNGVNLTSTNLSNANLSGANLANVTMTNTNVNNTNLSMVTQGNYSRFTVNWGWAGQTGATLPPTDWTCPPGYVVSANAGGKNNDVSGMEALGFRCVQVVNGVTSTNSQFVQILSNYSMSNNTPYWSECGSSQAAIGIQVAYDGNRVQNTGPTCALFPTGARANTPAMSLTNNGLNAGGQYGKYANGNYTCPTGQWLVGVQAQRSVDDNGSIYMINQIICQQWNQIEANGLVSSGLVGTPILGLGWALQGGQLIGPGVNLSGANLANANLFRVNLSDTNLTGTNLSNAYLDSTTGNGITGTPSLPGDNFLINGTLLGPTVGVVGANLTNAYMGHRHMWQMTFVNSNLSAANFEFTDLNDAFFDSSANIGNANLYGISGIRINLSWKDLTSNNLSTAVLQGGFFNKVTINGGSTYRGYGASWTANHTDWRYTTITNSILTGNLSNVNFRGVTSYSDSCPEWQYFPGPAYCNGPTTLYQNSETPGW